MSVRHEASAMSSGQSDLPDDCVSDSGTNAYRNCDLAAESKRIHAASRPCLCIGCLVTAKICKETSATLLQGFMLHDADTFHKDLHWRVSSNLEASQIKQS